MEIQESIKKDNYMTPWEAHELFIQAFNSHKDREKASKLLKQYKYILSIKYSTQDSKNAKR